MLFVDINAVNIKLVCLWLIGSLNSLSIYVYIDHHRHHLMVINHLTWKRDPPESGWESRSLNSSSNDDPVGRRRRGSRAYHHESNLWRRKKICWTTNKVAMAVEVTIGLFAKGKLETSSILSKFSLSLSHIWSDKRDVNDFLRIRTYLTLKKITFFFSSWCYSIGRYC